MKRAVILHGTDGFPEEGWFPWLKAKLEAEGFEVWVPQLPNPHAPDRTEWNNRLLGGRNLTDCIVVGHSSGGVEVLNMLMSHRCPHLRLGVVVSGWPAGAPVGKWDPGQFDNLFPPDGFSAKVIKPKVDRLEFLHGAKDPYCPVEATEELAKKLKAPITIVPEAGHFSGVKELPELWEIIEPSL